MRSEFAYVFGRILEEWAGAPRIAPAGPGPEHWPIFWQSAPDSVDLEFLSRLTACRASLIASIRNDVRAFATNEARKPATVEEVYALLGVVASDSYAAPERRRRASAIRKSATQLSEHAGVLTILLNNLDTRNWPEEGVGLRPLWKHRKWRPHLDEDMINGLFLQLIGLRWGMHLKRLIAFQLVAAQGWFPYPQRDAWDSGVDYSRLTQAATFFLQRVPDHLEKMPGGDAYSGGYGGNKKRPNLVTPLERLLSLTDADICFHEAGHPGDPCHVLHVDLKDYYPSIPHSVLLGLLVELGFPDDWLAFFGRYLAVPLRTASGLERVRRGLFLEHLWDAVWADLLLLFLDVHVYDSSGLRTLRAVDDIYVVSHDAARIASAWKAIGEFCSMCGLTVNEEKSGAVTIGGETRAIALKARRIRQFYRLYSIKTRATACQTMKNRRIYNAIARGGETPIDLPQGLRRWGLLRLHENGIWHLDEEGIQEVETNLREELIAAPSVLDLVARYNDYVSYLQTNLALPVRLDDEHLTRVGERLAALHERLMGEGGGILAELRRRLGRDLLDPRLRERGLPESLFYWPITAGASD